MGIKLVAVRRNEEGQITHFLTDDQKILSVEEAERFAQTQKIDSLTEIHADGTWCIGEALEKTCGINLTNLPEF